MSKVNCIVIFRIAQLGDTIVSLPAIWSIRKAYPSAKMVLITDRHPNSGYVSSWEILGATGIFDEVLFYVPKALNVFSLFKMVKRIRTLYPDKLFYLVPTPRTNRQVKRDKLFFEIFCNIKDTHNLRTQDGKRENGVPNEVDRLLSVVADAGITVPSREEVQFDFPISDNIRCKVDRLMREKGLINQESVVVAICPGSKMQAKRWPEENYCNLGLRLLERYENLHLLIVGGPEDKELGDRFCNAWRKRTHNLVGISVLESAEVLRRCSVYIGNDTGTMHLASAVKTPCVAIFSARDVVSKWFPYGNNHIVLRKTVSCSPCFKNSCKNLICLKQIRVEDVLAAFALQMNKTLSKT